MVQICRKSAKGFSHGGPRRGIKWEEEQARVALQRAGLEEQQFPLWIVARQLRIDPRNLYFRLRRHRIPYWIGPKDGPPGRQAYLPESSMEPLLDVLWKRRFRRLNRVRAQILSAPL